MDVKLSQYAQCLSNDVRQRYIEKLAKIDFDDPYLVEKDDLSFNAEVLPNISYPDIVNYLIFAPSAYTAEQLKAYKSLEAYNQFINGWVRDVGVKRYGNFCLVIGKVLHSQRLSEAPLQPWIVTMMDGKILSAHCNCMAGLGELRQFCFLLMHM